MGNEATHAQKAPTAIAEEEKSNNGSSRGPRNSELSIHERPSRERLVQHLRAPIRVTYLAELELLLLTFCTGYVCHRRGYNNHIPPKILAMLNYIYRIQDAVTFPDYHCFASNQTGNTVMLALATTVPKLEGSLFITKNIAVSLVLFLAGGWLTGQVSHHFVNKRSRLWLVFCNFLQSVMVFGAAGLQFKYGVHEKGVEALGVLALLAFASGSQVVQSRSLQMTEISTAVSQHIQTIDFG